MGLEFVNKICPNCKNPNYMILLEDFSNVYKYKCMNCNGYFNDVDLEYYNNQIFEKKPMHFSGEDCLYECEKYKKLKGNS